MEMETSTMPPKASRLTVEKDALPSSVLEIIGGITLEGLQTLEDPEEREVWSMEEGDDSVFYSEEDRAHQGTKANTSCGFGADGCKLLVNSVAADEDDTEDESIMDEEIAELETEVTQRVILTEHEEKQQELQKPKTVPMDQSDPAEPGAESNPAPEKSASTCGESLNCTITDMQTQQIISAEKVNLPVEKEEVTPKREPLYETNGERYTRLSGEADVPEQSSSAQLQMPGDRQLQVEPEQDQIFDVPVGFHQNSSSGCSTLPLPKKSFNHLSPSKYDTLSYRKIRRGNTRQKIEEFECMVVNL
ncbi:hypothetical protein VZT92_005149 [Zoarces viviparus]|uniref:Ermin n=1 Tax=Zoarces viviparus TaxID=48416 RepID=A0AAW1FRG1_ZOAVI